MENKKKNQEKNQDYNSDITQHDKDILGDKHENLRRDGGDDQQLIDRKKQVDFEGEDLDVPGRTLPEDRTKKTLKDEENQLYSQGGESDNNDLEENQGDQ